MMTIYHAAKPFLALLTCYRHLGYQQEEARVTALSLRRNWQAKPLFIAGRDLNNEPVACLVYGRHQAMFCRALAGTAAIFSRQIALVDIDKLRHSQKVGNFAGFLALSFTNLFPSVLSQSFQQSLAEFGGANIIRQQEGQT